jgi:hypothetical protein
LQSAKNIAAANNHGYLDAYINQTFDLIGIMMKHFRLDAVLLIAHERFSAEFEKDAFVFQSHSMVCFSNSWNNKHQNAATKIIKNPKWISCERRE